jgi:DNA end-binding protein Ku
MRAVWTGSLSFGLVNIPVRLYGASEERALNFHLLDKSDLSPISYQKVSHAGKKVVPQKDIVRGYKVNGRYVVLSDEDFKKADARKVETIDIVQFADEKDIEPEYYDKPYYIEPQKKSAKAYALLRDALQKSGKVAIGRYVLRDKEHVGAISTDGHVLILDQLRYLDEIRNPRELNVPQKSGYSDHEMQMAIALIDSQTRPFDPREFKDTYADQLRRLIAEKARGKTVKAKQEAPVVEATDVSEILEMLKKSLESMRQNPYDRQFRTKTSRPSTEHRAKRR